MDGFEKNNTNRWKLRDICNFTLYSFSGALKPLFEGLGGRIATYPLPIMGT